MAWVVDTYLVIDVLDADPEFGVASAQLIDDLVGDGLLLAPVSYVELAPAFGGERDRLEFFLAKVGIGFAVPWEWRDTAAAFEAWNRQVTLKRQGRVGKRPVADVLIGAFATRFQGLLTRNESYFSTIFPQLRLRTPLPSEDQ